MPSKMQYHHQQPESGLQLYVDGFWSLNYGGSHPREVILLPDGKIDLFLSWSRNESFHISLLGLTTLPEKILLLPGLHTFAISFHPLAVEYLLGRPVAGLLNSGIRMPDDFWGFSAQDGVDFEGFCQKATRSLKAMLAQPPDLRKVRMQQLLLDSKGNTSVQQVGNYCYMSTRQLNRYWMKHLGMPLKSYLQLLRFRAAFPDIKRGKLYPQGNYADQSHFIREVKRLSGHLPKELLKNQNDRFIQFSVLD